MCVCASVCLSLSVCSGHAADFASQSRKAASSAETCTIPPSSNNTHTRESMQHAMRTRSASCARARRKSCIGLGMREALAAHSPHVSLDCRDAREQLLVGGTQRNERLLGQCELRPELGGFCSTAACRCCGGARASPASGRSNGRLLWLRRRWLRGESTAAWRCRCRGEQARRQGRARVEQRQLAAEDDLRGTVSVDKGRKRGERV